MSCPVRSVNNLGSGDARDVFTVGKLLVLPASGDRENANSATVCLPPGLA